MELSREERVRAASALEVVLQVEGGDVAATPGQLAYIAGTAAGLRSQPDLLRK